MAEIPFEYLLAGIETARGTALANPTHHLNLSGVLTPMRAVTRPLDRRGTLAEFGGSQTMQQWTDFSGEGALDVYTLPMLLNALMKGGVTAPGTQPADAVLTQLWQFVPTMNSDDLDSLTVYWGDPNVQAFQSTYCLLDELTIGADASGTDGASVSISGQGRFPTKTAPGAVPAFLKAPFLMPGAMQLWIDSGASAIGTTAITGRVVSAEVKIPSGVTRKHLAAGPGLDLNFSGIGRAKRHAEMALTFELVDLVQYDLWAAGTSLKTRLRINGPKIETVGTPTKDYYHYVEVDMYGSFDGGLAWGEHEGSNRTIELTILSEQDDTAGYDLAIRVQSDRATL